jgi:hypothetical protein
MPHRSGRPAIRRSVVARIRGLLKRLSDPYRPELHYMRGPGPKWHEKHGQPEPDKIALRPMTEVTV